ncbi:MAG: hypothetical protein AAGH79_11810 [Bacteroidota bacterium]
MAIIEHKEYKIICDNCGSDVTEYVPGRNKTDALRYFKAEYKKEFKRGSQLCEECGSMDDMSSRKKDIDIEETIEYFKAAKPTSFLDFK